MFTSYLGYKLMPKPFTNPYLLNSVLKLDINDLKRWGYLRDNQINSTSYNWYKQGYKIASIGVIINTVNPQPYVYLDYKSNEKSRSYKVNLVTTQSNLGIGKIWYFRCPKTNKRCRYLYSVNGYFYHREAFNNAMYESQTYGKKDRALLSYLEPNFMLDNYYSQLYKKYFKRTYAGVPTKRYLKLMENIKRGESIPFSEVERAMLL